MSIAPSPQRKNLRHPPRLATRFLAWYCHPHLLDEIEGDLLELYSRDTEKSRQTANWKYIWNVIRFFRWRNISKKRFSLPFTSNAMFKSYLLSGLRNIRRNAVTSSINLIGLSVALGCAIMIFILEDSYYNLDAMHEKKDRIGLITHRIQEGEGTKGSARSPHQFKALLEQNTAVEMVARGGRSSASVRNGDIVFREGILYADPEFMSMFSFRMIAGDRGSLRNKHTVLISQAKAIKYFGSEQAVGQTLSMKFTEKDVVQFTVGGVFEDTPANSSMYFSFLVPSEVWMDMNPDKLEDWSLSRSITFVLLKKGSRPDQLEPTLAELRTIQNKANPDRPIIQSAFLPLEDVAQESYLLEGSLSWSNAPTAMIAFWVIAGFLLLLASLNYMNISVATVALRLKEIGIRKVVGSGRKELIIQFLTENFVLCFLALIVGTAISYFLLLPGFNALFPVKTAFEISSWYTGLAAFSGLLIVVALISGAYPAFYISSFNAVNILKGKERFGNKSLLSRILLTLQFTLSITIMVGSLVFTWSTSYFETLDWGYDSQETIGIQLMKPDHYEAFRKEIANDPNVVGISGASRHIGKTVGDITMRIDEKEYAAAQFGVGPGYFDVMGVRLKAGRFLDEKIESDKVESAVVNDTFVKKMGWSEPIGKSFEVDSVKRFIVGVVEDFYYSDFYTPVEPAVFVMVPPSEYAFLLARVQAGSVQTSLESIRNHWKHIAPDDPEQVFLQSEVFQNFINSNRASNKVIYFIAGVSVFLAAMGLYGLVAYNLTRRLKEFSIRKVFGASVPQIFRLMNGDYIYLVLIAFLLGAPLGAYLMSSFINSIYPFPIPLNYAPYWISITVMVLVVAATIASQLRRITRENPVETLRTE